MLGKELRNFAQDKISEIKENNRDKNLKYHIEEINKIVLEYSKKTNASNFENENLIKNAEKIVESLETIQDIDPLEKELSLIWQNLIASLRSGQHIPQELISILKTLSPIEAKILMRISSGEELNKINRAFKFLFYLSLPSNNYFIDQMNFDRHYYKSLVNKSLLEKTYIKETLWLLLVITVGGLVFLYYSAQSIGLENFLPFPSFENDGFWRIKPWTEMVYYMFLNCSVMFIWLYTIRIIGASFYLGYGKYRLSFLGRELLKYVSINNN
jgi:hypothetical protein